MMTIKTFLVCVRTYRILKKNKVKMKAATVKGAAIIIAGKNIIDSENTDKRRYKIN